MSFQGHFPVPRLRALRDAAMGAGIGTPIKRDFLLAGIDSRIAGGLTIVNDQAGQVLADLLALNKMERLVDGSVPIAIWLENAEDEARPRPEAAAFSAARKEISDRSDLRPAMALPAALEEKNEIVIHEDDMLPLWFLTGGIEAGKSVAKVLVPRCDNGQPTRTGSGEPVVGWGTGWLLTPDLLITNHHVINARHSSEGAASAADFADQARAAEAQFDFDADGVDGTKYQAGRVEASDPVLDFAILRLKKSTGRKGLQIAPERLVKKQNDYVPVNIIQHPNARFKKIAIRNNLITASSATELRYFTDTDSGSSGSPVLDDQWRVVALHRGAIKVDNVQYQGRSSAWVNYGTPVLEIFDKLQANHQLLYNEIQGR